MALPEHPGQAATPAWAPRTRQVRRPQAAAGSHSAGGAGARFARLDGPAGPLFVAFGDLGVRLVEPVALVGDDPGRFAARWRERFGEAVHEAAPPPGLEPALAGRGEVPLDLGGMGDFDRAVLAVVAEIPRGEVRPYAWVAAEIGRPGAVRAVGSALARNPVPILVPCHRVIRSDGAIGNYAYGAPMKAALLSAEGVDLAALEALRRAGVRLVVSRSGRAVCLPSCRRARQDTPGRHGGFARLADALAAGYRPCPACRPTR
ncbi:MAG TPA: MGMT family protein [Acidimicrobiales bacterium]|nr:MGMT family protein [Acidimicrobiales bacterium]